MLRGLPARNSQMHCLAYPICYICSALPVRDSSLFPSHPCPHTAFCGTIQIPIDLLPYLRIRHCHEPRRRNLWTGKQRMPPLRIFPC